MTSWDEAVSALKAEMDGMHSAREAALAANRVIIQVCSKCIKHVHRKEFDQARVLLDQAKAESVKARGLVNDHPEVLYAGYLQDAEKEMVEAAGCLAMVLGEPLPTAADLGVQARSYLNGMGECASEMRRTVLDRLREGDMDEAERLWSCMVTIYDDLGTFDYPDGLTGGLRRTVDALRAVIERTRGDLTLTKIQSELIQELKSAKGTVDGFKRLDS